MKTYGDISAALAAYVMSKKGKRDMEGWSGDNYSGSTWMQPQYGVPVPTKDPIENATDDELILELVKRGFAVGRLNENNQLEA